MKGAVHGGIGKCFSPMQTRRSKKLKGKEDLGKQVVKSIREGPRVLREQKALERGKQ